MKTRLHVIAMVLFALCFLYDLVVWGSVRSLPEVGPGIADSARREAPLATAYITLGEALDSAVPFFQDYGAERLNAFDIDDEFLAHGGQIGSPDACPGR